MDRNRQDTSGTKFGPAGGRTLENLLEIDWQTRAESIWKLHPSLRRSIKELWERAQRIDAHTIGVYEDFRRKFNGTRTANEAHAQALYAAGQFDRAGVSLAEWISQDADWAEIAQSLSPADALGVLAARATEGKMEVAASSTPDPLPPQWRRIQISDPAGDELHVNEYLQLTVTFPDCDDPAPVYLLALEWSAVSRDWQVFNTVKRSLLDLARSVPVALSSGNAVARVPVGVKITGPLETFDLFVLGQRTPFDHRARAYLETVATRPAITPLEMGRLVDLLFKGSTIPAVASTRYAVVA